MLTVDLMSITPSGVAGRSGSRGQGSHSSLPKFECTTAPYCPHLSPGTRGLCSTLGSSSSYGIHRDRSRYKAWNRRRWSSGRPWLWANRSTDRQSAAPGSVAGTRCHPAAQDQGSSNTLCLRKGKPARVILLISMCEALTR
ncbi:hypothetical protein XENOCAPTIV_013703, partial [Xenoophorus captivus]